MTWNCDRQARKFSPRKVREVLDLRVMGSRGALKRPILALPSSFVEREVLYALMILQRGKFGPDRLHPGGEGLHPIGQGLHSNISGNVVIGSHTIVVGDKC